MTYKEAMEKIDSLLVFGSRPGLETISKLLKLMGNPQDKLKYVHIAGTNGKGSVSNMTASVLTKAGYKTGLFTSPHITGFGERMQINNKRISEQAVVNEVERFFPLVEQMRENGDIITEFEFVTAIAFHWFCEQKCDVVVLETGLGGRCDSTNVIKTPLCSVITSISLDHTGVLGDTLEKIADEKCGIIKKGGSTVFAFQEDEVNNKVVSVAAERDNILYNPINLPVVSSDINGSVVDYGGLTIKLPLIGEHQISNLALVLCTVEALRKRGMSIPDTAVTDGIASVRMPARFELISQKPLFILDGAHNPGGLKALSNAIDKYLDGKKIICIMGMLRDKDCEHSLEFLKGKLFKLITTTVPDSPRRQSALELKQTAGRFFEDISAFEDPFRAVDTALELAKNTENSAVLVCGSLYLAADIRLYLTEKLGLGKCHLG